MVYIKPVIVSFTAEELSDEIIANACSTYSGNCTCGGYHCPCNTTTGPKSLLDLVE